MANHVELDSWIGWAALLTLESLVVGLIAAPIAGMTGAAPLGSLSYWIGFVVEFLAAFGFIAVCVMALRRIPDPLVTIRTHLHQRRLLSLLSGCMLVALNFTAFGFIKPELNSLGFSADPALASADRLVLGADGWRAFEWFRHPYMGQTYHALWLGWLFLVLVLLLWQSPSSEKSRALVAYFLLWLLGPLVHLAMPAAGPVLHFALTNDPHFNGLLVVPADAEKFNYLLSGFQSRTFNPAGGISAMPSLHIATMAWTVIACRRMPMLRAAAIAITIYMWVASVALGWHYFVDGAAGIALAVLGMFLGKVLVREPK